MKSDLRKVAKVILDKIYSSIRSNTGLLQWRNFFQVIAWFDKLPNKISLNFLKMISAVFTSLLEGMK